MSTSALRELPAIAPAKLDVRPITPLIGAEIYGIDLRQPLDDSTIAAIEQALVDWKVLAFRDQHISDEDQLRFGRYFGKLTPAHPLAAGTPEHPEIWQRHAEDYAPRHRPDLSIPSIHPPRDYKGWHIDITFVANPNKYSILRGVKVPEYGGDTLWSNLEAAYEALSQDIREGIENLKAVHGGGYERVERQGKHYVALHPVVRVHPVTGRKSLFVSPGNTSHIVGLNERENNALLNLLKNEVTRDEYQVRLKWAPGTLVIWDNQNTAHAGPIDYAHFHAPRVVRRITVAGDLPEGPDGFRSRPLAGELFEVIG
jgi:taurine dioxygenase